MAITANSADAQVGRWQRWGLAVGLAGAVLCLGGFMADRAKFFQAYLLGYIFWLNIAGGSLGLLMIHHLVGGRWGCVVRRQLEAAARTFPLLAVLFIPLLFGIHDLYEWSHPEAAADPVLMQKAAFLNENGFITRSVGYLLIWSLLAGLLSRWSRLQDQGDGESTMLSMRKLSGIGLVIYGLTTTFASVDWMMSLEPHWFSTIYGALFMVGQGLAALSLAAIVTHAIARRGKLGEVVEARQYHDIGNLMFAFTVLWAYMSIGQYIIIWSGNQPEENIYYIERRGDLWPVLSLVLGVLHFIVPFFLLLMKENKRRAHVLARIAVLLLVMRAVDLFWLIAPTFRHNRLTLHWLDFAAPLAVGGLWVAAYARFLRQRPLLPLNDPRFSEFVGRRDVRFGWDS